MSAQTREANSDRVQLTQNSKQVQRLRDDAAANLQFTAQPYAADRAQKVTEGRAPKARRNIEWPTPARAKRTLERHDLCSADDDDVAHRVNEPGTAQTAEARVMAPLCRVARGASKRKPRQHALQP